MKRNCSHVLAAFYGAPWCIHPVKLAEIEAVLWNWIERGPTSSVPAAAYDDDAIETDDGYHLVGSAAVVPIQGAITPRPTVFARYSGGASADAIGRALDKAVADNKVEHIVLDIDSPGGAVYGISTAAAKIAAARLQKPVTAAVNHVAASAAYWLASQAGEIVIDPDGEVGSIGVIWPKVDHTRLEEMKGIKTDLVVSAKSPFKGAMWPQSPQTPENRIEMQRQIDDHMEKFIAAVAGGRRVSAARVEADFGKGRMKLAGEAVALGMADRVGTIEAVVSRVNNAKTERMRRKVAADLARVGLPTA